MIAWSIEAALASGCFDQVLVSTDDQEIADVARKLGAAVRPDVDVYLMRNHGTLCCGADPEAAMRRVRALEAFCLARLAARIAARGADPGLAQILGLIGPTESISL